MDRTRHAIHSDRAGVRFIDSGKHIHQRRLSGTVFAEQGENLALPDVQIDVFVRDDTAKRLGNVL